jgi:integrase/recombinase XerD
MEEILLHQFAEKLELAGYAKRTIESYRGLIKCFFAYLDEKESVRSLPEVNKEHITGYQTWLSFGKTDDGTRLCRGGMANRLHALKTFFRIMHDEGLMKQDLAAEITAPRMRRGLPRFVPTVEQMTRIIESAQPPHQLCIRDRAIMELLYATGIRSEELRTLKLDDWNRDDGVLFITGKGAKDRLVPVGSWVVPWLEQYLTKSRPHLTGKSDLLFVSKTGGKLARSNLAWIIRKYSRKAGVERVSPPCGFIDHADLHEGKRVVSQAGPPQIPPTGAERECMRRLNLFFAISGRGSP